MAIGVAAERSEMVFGEIERQGEAAHEAGAEREHLGEVALHGAAEIGEAGRPLVRSLIELAGEDPRVVGGDLRTDVEALLEIGRCAGLERLAAQRLVAAIGARRLVDRAFRSAGKAKNAAASPNTAATSGSGTP